MKERYLKLIMEEVSRTIDKIDEKEKDELIARITGARRLFIAGKGRSGFVMNAFAVRMMQMGFKVHVAGEPTTPAIGKGDLLLVGSGSGETSSLVVMSEMASKAGASVALVTMNRDSAVAANSSTTLVIPAGGSKTDKDADTGSIQPMCNLFEQCLLIFLDWLCMSIMDRSGIDNGILYERHANLE